MVTDTVCGTADTTFTVVNSTIGLNEFGLDQAVRVYPNPSNGLVQLVFEGSALEGNLELVNSLGQVVLAQTFTKVAGEYHHPLNLSELPKGIYQVRVLSSEGSTVLRVVLQ